jgi:hypothetical protein
VLGHDDVADDYETVATTNFFQDLQQQVAVRRLSQQRHPPITTGGDEVEIACT